MPNQPPVHYPVQPQPCKASSVKVAMDFYRNLEELKSDLKEGKDFAIEDLNRKSNVTIVSPHGGFIEPGTSELARAIAGDKYNLFDFQLLRKAVYKKGHITSTHFKDKQLTALLEQSRICISLHRMKDKHETVYLGGANQRLKDIAYKELSKNGFKCTKNPPRLKGASLRNFVNQVSEKGLQIEIPVRLAKKLIPSLDKLWQEEDYMLQTELPKSFDKFVKSIRDTIEQYLATSNSY